MFGPHFRSSPFWTLLGDKPVKANMRIVKVGDGWKLETVLFINKEWVKVNPDKLTFYDRKKLTINDAFHAALADELEG